MANFAFMEFPSNQFYPGFPSFAQFTIQETSPNSCFGGPTQFYDPFNAYQDSTTHNCFNDQIGLYASSPFKSNDLHQPEITQLPSVSENHKIAKSRKKNAGKASARQRWSKCEDRLLMQLVEQYGERNWARIAEKLPTRTGKQCRDKWVNCLSPNIMKSGWSKEDDKLLVSLHKRFGNKWAEIARNMPGRSENSIKNHWNTAKRKQLEFSSYLLKDYITSVSSSSSGNQINILESLHEPQMSLNASSSPFSGSGLGYKLDELVVNGIGFHEVSSHLVDQLQFDPQYDMDFIGSLFDLI